jgi:pyrroline-5-carboxylate reductase
MSDQSKKIAILGAGNIGTAIADGLKQSGKFEPENIILTRRRVERLESYHEKGFVVSPNNQEAIQKANIIIITVEPQRADALLKDIKPELTSGRHMIISVVSGMTIQQIKHSIQTDIPVVRAMPNTAIALRESMTCLCSDEDGAQSIDAAASIFDTVGQTLVIHEEQMSSATALCACGIAFFLRAIRAASQGGIEIGFHAHDALQMASQTAKGAASLLASMENHPEFEIDRVTTPRGCTISGLNQMEHEGFSSAMIQGILTSAQKADKLYDE